MKTLCYFGKLLWNSHKHEGTTIVLKLSDLKYRYPRLILPQNFIAIYQNSISKKLEDQTNQWQCIFFKKL